VGYRDLQERQVNRIIDRRRGRVVAAFVVVTILYITGLIVWAAFFFNRYNEPRRPIASAKQLAITFGFNREPITRIFTVNVKTQPRQRQVTSQPVISAKVRSDLRNEEREGEFPANQLTVGVNRLTDTQLNVAVTANPWTPEKVKPGVYEGILEVRGTGISKDIPLFISLRGREYKWAAIAFGLLLFGALLGLMLKWITERLTPQAGLIRRLNTLKRAINYKADGTTLPVSEQIRLNNLEDEIAREEYASVEKLFDEFDEKKFRLATVSSQFEILMDYLATQSELIRSSKDLNDRDHNRLNGILDEEYRYLRQLQTIPWPEQKKALERHFQVCKDTFATISTVMFQYCRYSDDPELREVLDKYQLGKFPEGNAAFLEWSRKEPERQKEIIPPPPGHLRRLLHLPGSNTSNALPKPNRRARAKAREDDHPVAFIFRHARAIAGVTSVLVVALVGLKVEYLDNQGFKGDLADWLALGLWATVVELSGVSILDVLGRLGGSSSPAPSGRL
jgi:hypothetical protein